MDRLQSMRVFAKVVEQGSFARAAQALDMSNAVVTRHVADLESHLSTRLLNRTTRKLSLTETGHSYLERVVQILQEVDDAEAIASSHSKKPTGTLRIYSHLGFGQLHLAKLLPEYSRLYPEVLPEVTLSHRTADLVEDGFDVGIFIGIQKFDASMVARQLAQAETILCASPDYVKRHGTPGKPEDISRHACLNFSFEQLRHSWPLARPDNSVINIPINSRLVSNNGELLRQSALAGMGIMIRPSFSLDDDLSSGRLVRLLPHHHLGQLSVTMVYPSRRLLSAKVRSFVDFMIGKFPHPERDPWLEHPAGSSLAITQAKSRT
ncbi:LysR family transcriptional regulator [Noviherbaspirillum cavernae]|uniref:LysR family transcriptional regulator n=1 Tax=Noviherbaspirillum cavernae TaxID=2320862 RepID=A0A418WX33_9BURK|nr:LysR family transcriptional regulator [Noviherbaspirillum cavernae]RJG04798.1 LysR family transcriptional regulator [Noviherbaspirillum cavernae]